MGGIIYGDEDFFIYGTVEGWEFSTYIKLWMNEIDFSIKEEQ